MSACWSEEALSRFPVRKTRAQKEAFRAFASERFASRGWRVAEETGGIARSVNLIVGDVARAKIVFAAHYDTCAALPVPNFIAPSNWAATLLYQVALGVCLCVPAALVSAAVALLLRLPLVAGLAGCLCCAALVALMLCGPANRSNANDNTSGVCVLAETILSLSPDTPVAFVFFDHEEWGLLGSSAFFKAHRAQMQDKPLLNFDCVSDGSHFLIARKKGWRRNAALDARLQEALRGLPEGKTARTAAAWTVIYPSDQAHFPCGAAVVALRRHPLLGHYLSRIHTRRDTRFDPVNIAALREVCVRLCDSFSG